MALIDVFVYTVSFANKLLSVKIGINDRAFLFFFFSYYCYSVRHDAPTRLIFLNAKTWKKLE